MFPTARNDTRGQQKTEDLESPVFHKLENRLFQVHGRTGVHELLLDVLGVGFRNFLLDDRRDRVNEVLGFLQALASKFPSQS